SKRPIILRAIALTHRKHKKLFVLFVLLCFFVAERMKISATIITFNEERNIKAACESLAWADEILVVDSNSTDATREIAEATGARVIVNPWPGFGAQKQFAVEQAQHDWIFSLDADERVSDELRN